MIKLKNNNNMNTEVSKFIVELIAISLIWFAAMHKREKPLKPFTSKSWWVQFTLIVIAVILIKNIHKI
jgi:arginine exporter protein ArgO